MELLPIGESEAGQEYFPVESYVQYLSPELYDPQPSDGYTKEEQLARVRDTLEQLVRNVRAVDKSRAAVIEKLSRERLLCPLRFDKPQRSRWCVGPECAWWAVDSQYGPEVDAHKGCCAVAHSPAIVEGLGFIGGA